MAIYKKPSVINQSTDVDTELGGGGGRVGSVVADGCGWVMQPHWPSSSDGMNPLTSLSYVHHLVNANPSLLQRRVREAWVAILNGGGRPLSPKGEEASSPPTWLSGCCGGVAEKHQPKNSWHRLMGGLPLTAQPLPSHSFFPPRATGHQPMRHGMQLLPAYGWCDGLERFG